MDVNAADSTSTLAVPVMGPSFAVMVTTPADWPLTSPLGLTVATLLLEDVHVHNGFNSCTELSVKVPLAAIPTAEPGAIAATLGFMAIEARVAVLTVSSVDPF